MTSSLGSGKTAASYFDKEALDTNYRGFIQILGSVEQDFKEFMDDMSFAGFNKERMAVLAASRLGARRTLKLVFLAAYRGTNLTKILARSVRVDQDVKSAYEDKLVLSNGKGPNDLTMGRLLACFPQFAAFYMMKLHCPKKIVGSECPACIQFPAAASLPMSSLVRAQHIHFCKAFSGLIGSRFDPKFYVAAFRGAESVKGLNEELLIQLGEPRDDESQQVDVQALCESVQGPLIVVPSSGGGVALG